MKSSFSLLLLVALTAPLHAQAVTDQQVSEAIGRVTGYLYSVQNAEAGDWGADIDGNQPTGRTALVLMAMLAAGESAHNPRIDKALRFLEAHDSDGTYARALRAHVWAALPDEYADHLQIEGAWLKQAHNASLYDYGSDAGLRFDHSCTQYGILGMWEYVKRGGQVSANFWTDAAEHFIDAQNGDGGWGYQVGGSSTGSMTTAGLTVLYIARQWIQREHRRADAAINAAIAKGLDWLDRHFDGGNNPPGGGRSLYYLYGIERVALASGIKLLNGQDWFESGAVHILGEMGPNGSMGSLEDTAFALAFLARGRVPVWANKISITDMDWNNRPNDLYFLTRYLSDNTEQELNWQIVDIDSDPHTWRNAPVAYLASDEKIVLSDHAKSNLKRYIDLGGIVLASSDSNSKSFQSSIFNLGLELYPELSWRRALPGDPLFDVHHRINPKKIQPIHVLSNGARDLIYLVERDWGFNFQSDNPPGKSVNWKIASNFYALATDRGLLDNRLEATVERRMERDTTATVTVGRAMYNGLWDMEPVAWEMLDNHVFNRTGISVEQHPINLEEIGQSPHGLIHLGGVESHIRLTEAQVQAIKDYVDGGGTLFVETVGGREWRDEKGRGKGIFSRAIEAQLTKALNTSAVTISVDHPLISGKSISGSYDAREVEFTRSTVTKIKITSKRPKFVAFHIDDRPAVIISTEDLCLALLNVRQGGVLGYTRDSARGLMTNLVLGTRR